MSTVRFVQTNPQPERDFIPELRVSTKFSPTSYSIAVFREHTDPRRIPIASGRIEIRPGRQQPKTTGGEFLMPRPGEAEEGSTLRIINLTPTAQKIRLTDDLGFGDFGHITKPATEFGFVLPKLFSNQSDELVLSGLGSSVELFATGRMWVVVASHNAKLI